MIAALEARLASYCALFAGLSPEDLARLPDFFAADARFKDPFNDVRGVAAIQAVFAHMFAVTEGPRFEILERALSGSTGFVRWRFRFAPRGCPQAERTIEGVSRVAFAADGRVAEHLDYWDPVEGLYDSLPLIGAVLRLVRRRLSAGPHRGAARQSQP
jgi:ketosteroid isomerase-like protein